MSSEASAEPVPGPSSRVTPPPEQQDPTKEEEKMLKARGMSTPESSIVPSTPPTDGTKSGSGGNKTGKKGKKRKKGVREHHGGPRQPLNGYVRFMNDNRERVRTEYPNLPFPEIMKVLAGEWSTLPHPDKQKYLDAAEVDRERYQKELSEYKQTDAYKEFAQQQKEKKKKREEKERDKSIQEEESESNHVAEKPRASTGSGSDVPIFTEEFMEHNKGREAELRQLRKSNVDCEEQNAVLHKYVANMKQVVETMEEEFVKKKAERAGMQKHLYDLRRNFVAGFANLPLPGSDKPPDAQDIDEYVTRLHSLLAHRGGREHESFVTSARDVIAKMDFRN